MKYTKVGKIINTHGIKGEVKILPMTDDKNRFSLLEKIYFGKDKVKLELEKARPHKSFVILKFKEHDNINDVIFLKEENIYVDEEDEIKLPENSYFIDDLIDCKVFDVSKREIGTVKDIIYTNRDDVYLIESSFEDKEYMIPARKEFIKEIDIENKKIIIDPIEGMIE